MNSQNPYDLDLFQTTTGSTSIPLPGNSVSLSIPATGRSELLALAFTFTTDANAANRYLALIHTVATKPVTIASAYIPPTASLPILWTFAPGLVNQPAMASGRALIALPPYPALQPADTLTLFVHNIQAGDACAAINHTFKIWPHP